MSNHAIDLQYKERIIAIISMFLPKARIFLFGSRARGDNTQWSDIDIAIDNGEKIPRVVHAQIIHMIDVLNIPQKVDVVDFSSLSDSMKNNITKEGIVWKNLITN